MRDGQNSEVYWIDLVNTHYWSIPVDSFYVGDIDCFGSDISIHNG
jgi:hypothetical protein